MACIYPLSRVDQIEWNAQVNCYRLDIPMKQAVQIVSKTDPNKFTVVEFENDDFIFKYLNLGNLPEMSKFLNGKAVQLVFLRSDHHETGGVFNIRLESQDSNTGKYSRKCINYANQLADCPSQDGYRDDAFLFNLAPYSETSSNNFILFDNLNPIDLSNVNVVKSKLISQDNSVSRRDLHYNDGYWRPKAADASTYNKKYFNVNYLQPGHLCDFNNGLCGEYCREDDNGLTRTCTCTEGFRLAYDGVSCQDINECEDQEANVCGHLTAGSTTKCMNLIGNTYGYRDGGFSCYCDFGWSYDTDSKSCIQDKDYWSENWAEKRWFALYNSKLGCPNKNPDRYGHKLMREYCGKSEMILRFVNRGGKGELVNDQNLCLTFSSQVRDTKIYWQTCKTSNKGQIFRPKMIHNKIRFENSESEHEGAFCLHAYQAGSVMRHLLKMPCATNMDVKSDGTVNPWLAPQLFDIPLIKYSAPDSSSMVSEARSNYLKDSRIKSADLNNFCNFEWGRIFKGTSQYELVCINHETGEISHYNYQTGAVTLDTEIQSNCIGHYYDITVFVSNYWGVKCINQAKQDDEFGVSWCRYGSMLDGITANLLHGDWDNDGIDDLMCFGHDGVIKMAYGTSDGKLVKDQFPRYSQYFTNKIIKQFQNVTTGKGNHQIARHFFVYPRDNNQDGLLDVVAYSIASTGNIFQMNATPSLKGADTYHNHKMNKTMVSCSMADSVKDSKKNDCLKMLDRDLDTYRVDMHKNFAEFLLMLYRIIFGHRESY